MLIASAYRLKIGTLLFRDSRETWRALVVHFYTAVYTKERLIFTALTINSLPVLWTSCWCSDAWFFNVNCEMRPHYSDPIIYKTLERKKSNLYEHVSILVIRDLPLLLIIILRPFPASDGAAGHNVTVPDWNPPLTSLGIPYPSKEI